MRKKMLFLGMLFIIVVTMTACQSTSSSVFVEATSTLVRDMPISPIQRTAVFQSPILSPASQESIQIPARFPGKIAFHSNRTGLLEVYVLDGETGTVEAVTNYNKQAFEPSWSPDCSAITFSYGGNNTDIEVYKMELDGDNISTNLSNHPEQDDWMSAWSPKGDLIAYQNDANGRLNICFMDINGQDKGCIKQDSYNNALPAWSPDGNLIAFISDRDGDWEIFTILVGEDTEATQLTYDNYTDTQPQFSSDGSQIIFSANSHANYDVFLMNADGTDVVRLTTNVEDDVMPHWLGDKQVVFSSKKTRDWELYFMNNDGTNVRRLTNMPGLDKWPVWCSEK